MRLARWFLFPQIFMLAVLLARATPAAPAGVRPIPSGSDGPPPVILISVDTLRADHLSCYGYSRLRTPHIDALERGGTLFAEISSQAPITLPSHVSLFTSTYPFANGIRENGQIVPPGAVTLATILNAHGYNTAAFIGGYFLDRRYGMAQGFQTYDSPFGTRVLKGALDLKRPASQVLEAAEHWLEQNSGHPFLLFVHLFDLHQPYAAPAAYRARAPASEYDQELAYVDDSLGSGRWWCCFPITVRAWAITAKAPMGISSTAARCTCRLSSIGRTRLKLEIRNSKMENRHEFRDSSFQFPLSASG